MTSKNTAEFNWDEQRLERTGIQEAVYCLHKSAGQIADILAYHQQQQSATLLTRLSAAKVEQLPNHLSAALDFNSSGQIAIFNAEFNQYPQQQSDKDICIVTAGTSDMSLAYEAQVTLAFHGYKAQIISDVGVAGLHRLLNRIDDIRQYKLVIGIAGMEGALFSVLAGLIKSPLIAVPSSVGYGVSAGGDSALSSALASCSPGIVTVNIDNAFGAAVAAIKMISAFTHSAHNS